MSRSLRRRLRDGGLVVAALATITAAQGLPCPLGLAVDPAAGPTAQLGYSTDVSGDVAIAGAIYADLACPGDPACESGSAAVYRSQNGHWVLEQTLTADDGDGGDLFGISVAIDNDLAAVGALYANGGAGAVYVFRRQGTHWTQQQRLTASNGQPDDRFGFFISLSGDALLVGAPRIVGGVPTGTGQAYVFRREAKGWVEEQRLLASDGANGDLFGYGVALDADRALIGAWGVDHPGALQSGAAYFFEHDGAQWSEVQRVSAPQSVQNGTFAFSVDLSGDLAIAGAWGQGASFVYRRVAGVWTYDATLTPTAPGPGERFGHDVAIVPDIALVGVLALPPGGPPFGPGSTYAFTRSGSNWSQSTRVTLPDPTPGDGFGRAVALDGPLAFIGAPGRDDACPATDCDAGAAYWYRITVEPFADFNVDGDSDFPDFAAFQRCFTGPGPLTLDGCCVVFDADLDSDVDVDDFAAFKSNR